MVDLRDRDWLAWLKGKDAFSWGYLSCPSPHHVRRLAQAREAYWRVLPPVIEPEDLLVGRLPARPAVAGYSFGSGIWVHRDTADELAREHREWAAHLEALAAHWESWTPGSRVHLPEGESARGNQHVYWAGGWGGHAVLGYEEVLAEGTEGLRRAVLSRQTAETDPEKIAFREALLVICDGIDGFAQNYAQAAVDLAAREHDSARHAELMAIAARATQVPRFGARTFPEALQSLWFLHVLDEADSPGRVDQFLLPYYQDDLAAGRLTREEAQVWTDHLWRRFAEHRSWNVCVGGVRPDGSDGTNDLTYLALEAARRSGQVAPNLSLRLHRDSPPELWAKAVEVIATGIGMPALYNDDVLVPALMRYGIPEEEARDYALNGCSQVDIQGRSHMGLEDGELNLLKCLELALHDGFDPVGKQQLGPHTGDPRTFADFEQLWQAYTAQVEHFTACLTAASNAWQQAYAETSPSLLRSLLVEDCAERGLDLKAGGPRYNHGQILTQGIANTADALMALRKLVFEERRMAMAELLAALEADLPDASVRSMLLRGAPKFGNDEEEVDALAARLVEHFYRHLATYPTWRGGSFGGGAIVFTRAITFGANVGATPDGRHAGTPLADSVGAAQGRDRQGPTALLHSVARAPQGLALCAYVLNVKFSPATLQEHPEKVAALFRTYFQEGGQQLQVNVVDREALLAAQAQPELHQNLIVRVGGFSGSFVRLSAELQADVIARTEHAI
jgi:pyruvate-formate lyase